MPKKTPSTTRKRGQASSREEGGLIAKAKKTQQSAEDSYALDNRSHRTPPFRGAGPALRTRNLKTLPAPHPLHCDW
jgi:hypothetical protein